MNLTNRIKKLKNKYNMPDSQSRSLSRANISSLGNTATDSNRMWAALDEINAEYSNRPSKRRAVLHKSSNIEHKRQFFARLSTIDQDFRKKSRNSMIAHNDEANCVPEDFARPTDDLYLKEFRFVELKDQVKKKFLDKFVQKPIRSTLKLCIPLKSKAQADNRYNIQDFKNLSARSSKLKKSANIYELYKKYKVATEGQFISEREKAPQKTQTRKISAPKKLNIKSNVFRDITNLTEPSSFHHSGYNTDLLDKFTKLTSKKRCSSIKPCNQRPENEYQPVKSNIDIKLKILDKPIQEVRVKNEDSINGSLIDDNQVMNCKSKIDLNTTDILEKADKIIEEHNRSLNKPLTTNIRPRPNQLTYPSQSYPDLIKLDTRNAAIAAASRGNIKIQHILYIGDSP